LVFVGCLILCTPRAFPPASQGTRVQASGRGPDPILNEYMSGGGNSGGVYNPANLGLFSYTHNNPVNLVDPDGNEPGPIYLHGALPQVNLTSDNPYVDVAYSVGNTAVNIVYSFMNAGLNALNGYGEIVEPHEAAIESVSSGVGPYGGEFGAAIVASAKFARGTNRVVKAVTAVGRVTNLKLIEHGSKDWSNAVKILSGIKKGKVDFRVKTASDAKKLLQEAKGNMNRYKNYQKRTPLQKRL